MMNKKGFTLIDTVVAIGLVSVVVLGAFNILVFIKENAKDNRHKIETLLTQTMGDRYLFNTFKNAAPSFNNLVDPIDLDDNKKNFFDLNTTFPVLARPPDDQTRTLTLKPGGPRTDFYVLVANTTQGPPRYIDPVKLYSITPATSTQDGTLTYMGPNYNNYFTSLNSRNLYNVTGAALPPNARKNDNFFVDGSILYFYATSTARSSALSLSGFYQSYGFFGRVDGTTIIQETFGGRVNTFYPNNTPMVNLDGFLRNLPPGNGSIPVVSARTVDFIHYFFKPSPSSPKKKFALFFNKWNGTKFANEQMVADPVFQVILKRESVADMTVSFDIQQEEPKAE